MIARAAVQHAAREVRMWLMSSLVGRLCPFTMRMRMLGLALAVVLPASLVASPPADERRDGGVLTQPGRFSVGVNYWASHAGTAMWRDWREDVVAKDLALLHRSGLEVLRVFPLWPDFQPLTMLTAYQGKPVELRLGEEPLPEDEAGRAGVSAEAMRRFSRFVDLAERNDLKLIVGLVTGWMSGRLFVPPAFEGRNVLTDPLVVEWQQRFVRHFVRRFRDRKAIVAWDLGNETNCMADVPSREAAWVWTAAITSAIRAEDASRPVVSGMHGLSIEDKWTIEDQAELTDLLTVHPYPVFTPHVDRDPPGTMRQILHATAEARYYAGVGGKPTFAEELGLLGPMVASEAVAADVVRANLFSLWAHDARALLWWCAFDQAHLVHAPYDWTAVERELGLFRGDGTPRPALMELAAFAALLKRLPFEALPPRLVDGVVMLTQDQDHWGVAYSTFVLAKQAGLDVEIQHEGQPLRSARLYLLPSIKGLRVLSGRRLAELRNAVAAGATLYVSWDGGFLSGFESLTGLRVKTRQRRPGPTEMSFPGNSGGLRLSLASEFGLALEPSGAEVLAIEADGNPAFTRFALGKGRVYFLAFPLEAMLATTTGGLDPTAAPPYWRIYRHLAEVLPRDRALRKDAPQVGLTEHSLPGGGRIAVAINYSRQPVSVRLEVAEGWRIHSALVGEVAAAGDSSVALALPPAGTAVLRLAVPATRVAHQ
jgi:hypothetical protein